MPAYFDKGFAVRTPSWHRQETLLTEFPTREEGMVLAGHNFTIVEKPLLVPVGEGQFKAVEGWKGLVHGNTDDLLSCVRTTYRTIQPEVLWDIAEAIKGDTAVNWETGGILANGKILWVLFWLDEPQVVATNGRKDNTATYPYGLISTYNDGRGALTASSVSVRVVCWNTFSAAEAEGRGSGRVYTFRHAGRVMDRIEEAREVLAGIRLDHQERMQEYKELLGIDIDDEKRELFLRRFIPDPPAGVASERAAENAQEARDAVLAFLHSPTCAGIENTGYGLFQAAVEYLDHHRKSRNNETLLRRTLLEPKPFKVKAARLVREVANA